MLSMENAMKRLAGAPEDHAIPPKRRRKPPETIAMSDSGDSDPEKSDSGELNFPPKGDPPKPGSSVTEDALLNETAQDFESDEQTDPKVAQKLADIVNRGWGSKLKEAKLKEKLAKYNPPDNCEKLTVPKVNPEIWSQFNAKKKKTDLKISNLQQIIRKITFATLQTTSVLIQNPTGLENNKMMAKQVDTIAMLGRMM